MGCAGPGGPSLTGASRLRPGRRGGAPPGEQEEREPPTSPPTSAAPPTPPTSPPAPAAAEDHDPASDNQRGQRGVGAFLLPRVILDSGGPHIGWNSWGTAAVEELYQS